MQDLFDLEVDLNLGLRYDLDTVRRALQPDVSLRSQPSLRLRAKYRLSNLMGAMRFMDEENRLTPADKNNIGPRFGLAQISEKTVIRGGYAVLDASPMQVANHNAGFRLPSTTP
ncbi:MAG: hypothetical protein WKF37_08845 [Bryobacteraceae bacterium]